MRQLRYAISFLYGFTLLYVVMVWLGGVLAALPVSRSYFAFFGREQLSLALFIVNTVVQAAPTVVLLGVGLVLPAWLVQGHPRRVVLWAAIGAASSYLIWTAIFSINAAPFSVGPWWSLPILLAPWLGLGLAVLLSSRVQRRGVQGEA